MADEPETQALNDTPESPTDEQDLDNLTAPTDTGEEPADDATESDDGDTVEDADDTDDSDEPPDERGPIPYNRFKSVNEEKKRYAQALEKAGFRLDSTTGEPVAIGDGWDTDPDEQAAIPATQLGQSMEQRDDNPNAWTNDQWHDYAREKGYDPATFDDNFWQLVGQQAVGEAAQTSAVRQQSAAQENQARTYIDTTLAGVGNDPYLSAAPEAVADLRTVIKQARNARIPYSQIARDMPYLRARAIEAHLSEIIEAAGGKVAKATAERRQRLTSQSPPASTAPVTAAPRMTAKETAMAQQMGIPANRMAAELQRMRDNRGEK